MCRPLKKVTSIYENFKKIFYFIKKNKISSKQRFINQVKLIIFNIMLSKLNKM